MKTNGQDMDKIVQKWKPVLEAGKPIEDESVMRGTAVLLENLREDGSAPDLMSVSITRRHFPRLASRYFAGVQPVLRVEEENSEDEDDRSNVFALRFMTEEESPFPTASFQLKGLRAKPSPKNVEFDLTLANDMKEKFGDVFDAEISNIAGYETAMEIDRAVISKVMSLPGIEKRSLDMTDAQELDQVLLLAMTGIAVKCRRGPANAIVVDKKTYDVIASLKDFTNNGVDPNMTSMIEVVGEYRGVKVLLNKWFPYRSVLLAYSGCIPYDCGAILALEQMGQAREAEHGAMTKFETSMDVVCDESSADFYTLLKDNGD